MGLFDCASGGGKQSGKKWATENRRPKERSRGTSPGPSFMRSTSRMSRSSLFASNASLGKTKTLDLDQWRARVLNYLYSGEGKEDIRILGVPYRQLGFTSVTDFIVAIPPEIYETYINMKPDDGLIKDDKVIWQRDGIAEPGVLKWTGYVSDSDEQVMGLQLDRKKVVPFGTHDGKGLFYCKPGHRAMVPADEVIPYRKFLRSFIGIVPRKESMTLDLNGASSSKGNPAKQRDQNWKQGDHVFLNQEKKWATIQWTGRIGSDTVVDIVYDKDKPADKRVVSPDEPPISRSLSLAEFINEIGNEDQQAQAREKEVAQAKAHTSKSKENKLIPPPPPQIQAPSEIDDEVFDESSQVNETTDDSAMDNSDSDDDSETETDSDDDDDDSENTEEDGAEVMTPPPETPATPPLAKKMSLENIVLYDDNLKKMDHQKSPKGGRKYEKRNTGNKYNEREKITEKIQRVEPEKRSKSLLSFGFKKKSAPVQKEAPVEAEATSSSLTHLSNNEKEKQRGRRFFRRRANSSDGEEFSRDSLRKNRPKSESGLATTQKVEVEQHLPPKEISQSVNYIDNNDVERSIGSSGSYDSSDYYRPASPGIKDTGIQISNAMNKFKEDKKKKKDGSSKSGSLTSFFFPKKNKGTSKEEKLDQMTATEIDIEKESQSPAIPVTKNSEDLVALPDEILTVETQETTEDPPSEEESIDDEKEIIEVPVPPEKTQRKGKSLISSLFSKKSKNLAAEEKRNSDAGESGQDVVVENPYANVPEVEEKQTEKLRNSEESLEESNRIDRENKGRSSFNFFSRKKKPVPEPVERDFSDTDHIDDNVFQSSIESHENPTKGATPVKLRKKSSEMERRVSSDSQDKKSAEKEKRNSFRNSFTRRFSLPRRKSSSNEKKEKLKRDTSLDRKEEKPVKPQRPKSLHITASKDYDEEDQELHRTNSASVLVDIQPWYSRRAPKKNVLDTSYSTPIDSSGRGEVQSPTSTSASPTPLTSDPSVPKHRMFTTPLRWGSKRSKKSTDSQDQEEYNQEEEEMDLRQVTDPKTDLPSVTSNSTVFTSTTPVLAPRTTFIDVTTPTPSAIISEPKPAEHRPPPPPPVLPRKQSKEEVVYPPQRVTRKKSSSSSSPPGQKEVKVRRRVSANKSSTSEVDEGAAAAVPLKRVPSNKSSPVPGPLIRLATPIGYGQKRTIPEGASMPTVPTFTAKSVPNAVWTPSGRTTPPVSALSVLQSLPVETKPTQKEPFVVTSMSRSPPSAVRRSPPRELPKSPPPIMSSSPARSPSPKIAQSPVFTLPKSPLPVLPSSPPTGILKSPPPELPKSPPPVLPKSPPPSMIPVKKVSSTSPPPIIVKSTIVQTPKPSKPIISDLPLIQTVTATPTSPTERSSTSTSPTKRSSTPNESPMEKASSVTPVFFSEPTPSSPVKVNVVASEPNATTAAPQSVPIGVTSPLRQFLRGEDTAESPKSPQLQQQVNLSRTPSIDRPPPLPTAPPPNRSGVSGPPVCVTPPTPKTPEAVPTVYASPHPPLKSALKQRKEIGCIPKGLKVDDRVLWYNGSTRVPGTIIRLYKDGTDKYTAVVKFDRESLQTPLTLVREGDAYEVTVEELLPTENNEEEEMTKNPSGLANDALNTTNSSIADKDSDDGLRKSSLKGPSVQFRQPTIEDIPSEALSRRISASSFTSESDDGTLPPAFVEEEINIACGLRRGVQSTEISSCLETLLFSMFYTTDFFDIYMLFENPYDDQPTTKEIKKILRTEIVKPLRETGFVGVEAVKHLREAILPLSTDLNSLSSKAEMMMFILFQRALNLKEFITYSSDIFDYHHQILLNHKDPSKCVTTQYLFENSLQLMDNFKLKTIPTPALILEMPRTNNKMVQYDAVVPNLTLNIGHLLENGPKICLCGMVAKFECRFCVEQTRGNSSIVYCDSCRGMSDQIHHQLGHDPILSPIIQITGLMDLIAVICVNKGHYVSYVKCGTERLSPWLYYDATIDEAPRVSVEQHLGMWLDRLEKYPGKYRDAFAHSLLAQLLTDNHICIYQSRFKGSYV